MAEPAARLEKRRVIEAECAPTPPDAPRTTGTLAVAFSLLRPLLTDRPVCRPSRRRPVN